LGRRRLLDAVLRESACSRTITTLIVGRRTATDRGLNARKLRLTYRFGKDRDVHEALTYFTARGSSAACRCRRCGLRVRRAVGVCRPRRWPRAW
jgi:hypothetical protein